MAETTDTNEPEDLIRYDILAQEALRGVVKKVIQEVTKTGLPGDHHFYITFDTQFAGVRLSSRMREKYPEEMTIVVQHQFWDLEATDSGFSIGLSFDNVPESLLVPFDSIRGFFDPSVQFGLQFDAGIDEPEESTGSVQQLTATKVDALPSPNQDDAAEPTDEKSEDDADAEEGDAAGSADVVSLDAFRKK